MFVHDIFPCFGTVACSDYPYGTLRTVILSKTTAEFVKKLSTFTEEQRKKIALLCDDHYEVWCLMCGVIWVGVAEYTNRYQRERECVCVCVCVLEKERTVLGE